MKHRICKEFVHFYKLIFIQKWLGKLILFIGEILKKNSQQVAKN
jgi:hypothetical protein